MLFLNLAFTSKKEGERIPQSTNLSLLSYNI